MSYPESLIPAADSAKYGLIWKDAVDPKEGKYPGLRPNLAEEIDGMNIVRDVAIPMRDGVSIYGDVFRSRSASSTARLPTLMTFSPYGKHAPKTFDLFPGSGVPKGAVSKHTVWEGCDPLYWTARGYAVINVDSRGSWASEGYLNVLGPQEAYDGYDTIEWIARQPWSNGRVGLCGVSYLAIVQWRIAQLNPPHLACINPWEGYTDAYRDHTHNGGIPETKFLHFSDWSCQFSPNRTEAWYKSNQAHELLDEYHESKRAANLAAITVPAYCVVDWGDHGLHTRGTLHGYETISSKHKWLEVHGRKKWQYFYQPSSLARQEAFYQKFLKGVPSEIDSWPRVRIEIRDRAYEGTWRDEKEWPIQQTRFALKYLDAESKRLQDSLPDTHGHISYDSLSKTGDNAQFVYVFDRDTEVTGSMRLRLWVSTGTESDDLDLFVSVDKLDVKGQVVPFVAFAMFDNAPLALGWLRASHRELDPDLTHHNRPWMKHRRRLPLRPDEIVPVDIEIIASSTKFRQGESLKLTIQGTDIFSCPDIGPTMMHENSVNKGKHTIYTGSVFDSYLVLPVID